VLVSSHLMSEMAITADHLLVIGRGRLIADTSVAEFIAQSSQRFVRVRSPRTEELATLLAARGASVSGAEDASLTVTGLEAAAIGDIAAGAGIALHELSPRQLRSKRRSWRSPTIRSSSTASLQPALLPMATHPPWPRRPQTKEPGDGRHNRTNADHRPRRPLRAGGSAARRVDQVPQRPLHHVESARHRRAHPRDRDPGHVG